MSTPQTSALLLERACCRIWRTTSLSTTRAGCTFDGFALAFMTSTLCENVLLRNERAQDPRRISVGNICNLPLSSPCDENIKQRQADLTQGPAAQLRLARIGMQCNHCSQLPIVFRSEERRVGKGCSSQLSPDA